MQKYVIICLLEDLKEGTEFSASNWPLHITLASNFMVDWEVTNLFEKLSKLIARHKSVTVTAGDDEYFGPQKQAHVTLINMDDALMALHNDIIALLKSTGAVFDEPQYLESGFKPHATVQRHIRLHKGDTVHISKLTIIDMFPGRDIMQRKVLKSIKLGITT